MASAGYLDTPRRFLTDNLCATHYDISSPISNSVENVPHVWNSPFHYACVNVIPTDYYVGAPCSSGGYPPLGVPSAPVSPAERRLDQCRLSLDSRRWHPEGGGDGWW